MGRHAELKGHSAARVGLTPILAPDPTACKWPIPSGSEVRPAMLPNVAPGAMRTLEDPMTGVQQSADVAVAPGKPTCFHLVDPQRKLDPENSGHHRGVPAMGPGSGPGHLYPVTSWWWERRSHWGPGLLRSGWRSRPPDPSASRTPRHRDQVPDRPIAAPSRRKRKGVEIPLCRPTP
jgi:hypothetical protein